MEIHQLTLRYDAEEDRMLLRLNTVDRQELRFALTRRFVRHLWPILLRLLARDQERRNPAIGHAASAVLAFEQERVMAKTDFDKKFEEQAAAYPLGETPVLLARIQAAPSPGGRDVLSLLPREGRGIELPAHPRMLHTLCRLIRDACGRADWDLNLTGPADPDAGSYSIH